MSRAVEAGKLLVKGRRMTVRQYGQPIWYQVHRIREEPSRTWQLRIPDALRPRSFRWTPPTDVFETESGGYVRVEIAGMSRGDLDLGFADGRLVIAGSRGELGSLRGGQCALKEIASGCFCVEVDVPWNVDTALVQASYVDGFLTVELPRAGDQATKHPRG